MLGIASPVTDEQRKIMETIANECYLQFCTIVSNSRHMTLENVKALADGRIYTASQAQKNNLIDYIGSLDDLDIWANQLFGTTDESIKYIWYEPKENSSIIKSFLGKAESSLFFNSTQTQIKSGIETILNTISKTTGIPNNLTYPAYYWKN